MELTNNIPQRPSPIRITLLVLLVASLLYPLFFAYIDRQYDLRILATELLFTPLRLLSIALICYGVIGLAAQVKTLIPTALRNLIEITIILICTYWFLVAFIAFIDQPLTGSNPADPESWVFRRHIGLYMLGTLFIYTFLSGLYFYRQAAETAAQSERLQQAYAQVRLQALRSQVNPHFLFNSLSVLSSLVHVDAELSERFILQLSKAYRYILEQKDHELVSLQDELAFTDAYFFLLQIRFDKKLELHQQVPGEWHAYRLPPLTLQLLIENAVKHNAMSVTAPLIIHLFIEGTQLVVRNNISIRQQQQPSTGIGLENIRKRYALLQQQQISVSHDQQFFTVRVPLLNPTP